MKKLMIAAAIVCAAAMVQASSFDWSSSKATYGIDDSWFSNMKAGTFDKGSVTMKSQEENHSIAYSVILAITDAAGTQTLDAKDIASYTSNKPKASGLSSDKIWKPATDEDPACSGTFTTYYQAVFKDKDGNTWTLKSNEITGGVFEFGSQSDLKLSTGTAPTTWIATVQSPEPTPEPTSGLLLLLGVAGLGLRRRRA